MIVFALKLILAHIAGDFVFQPDRWVEKKRSSRHRFAFLLRHVAVHALGLLILLQFSLSYWMGILVILLTHFVIDLLKLNLEKRCHRGWLFAADQVAHLLVIAGVLYAYHPFIIDTNVFFEPHVLLVIIALSCVTFFAAILVRLVMSKWQFREDREEESLPYAGKYIGMLERLLVFLFIIFNHWGAIGWLIAAKSVMRFSDLSRAKDRKLTEYILVGTLLSFALAIGFGLLYLFVHRKIHPMN